jgi:hypothetical protein
MRIDATGNQNYLEVAIFFSTAIKQLSEVNHIIITIN